MEPILNYQTISELEYFLKLSFFTADLHVARGWRLKPLEDMLSPVHYKPSLVISSAVELSSFVPSKSLNQVVLENESFFHKNQVENYVFCFGLLDPPNNFSLSNCLGTYNYFVFELVLGRVHLATESISESIPSGYDSLVFEVKKKQQFSSTFLVRIKETSQIVTTTVVEIEFKPLRMNVSPPICHHCEAYDASIYCHDDEVYLCDTCDFNYHCQNKFFMRHHRTPISQSPGCFGICAEHPTESISLCCLTCYEPLCSHCVIFGTHSSPELKDHQLVNPNKAYEFAIQSLDELEKDPERKKLQLLMRATTAQIERIVGNTDAISTSISSVSKKLIQHIKDIENRKFNMFHSIELQWLSIIQTIEWMDNFMKHLSKALPLGYIIPFYKRHCQLVSFMFHNNDPLSVMYDLEHDSKESCPIKKKYFCVPNLPQWVLQTVHLVGNLKILEKKPEDSSILPEKVPGEMYADKGDIGIPNPEWIPFITNKSPSMNETHDYYEVKNRDGRKDVVLFTESKLSPTYYEGPLIFSSNPRFNETQMDDKYCDDQKHLKELAKTIPDNEFKQAYADTVNIEKDILSMMSSNDEKKSIGNENKNASAYVPNKKSVLWDPKFQPRHKLHDELWWLLKEYRYEALVMILKTCPSYQRLYLMRHFCNAANYMSDFENFISVVFEVECYWVARLPVKLIAKYESFIIPLIQHILQSDDILIPEHKLFLTQLSATAFHRVHQRLEQCLNKTRLKNESKSEELLDIFVDDDPALSEALFQLIDKKLFDESMQDIVFEKLQPFLWEVVNETLNKHILVLSAKDIPCTIRSLLYYLQEYGSTLKLIHYPYGALYDASTRSYLDDVTLEHNDARCINDTKFKNKSDTDQFKLKNKDLRQTKRESSIALCIEAFMNYALQFSMSNEDKQGNVYINILTSWLLRLIFKGIGRAAWRLPNTSIKSHRFDTYVGSNDEEMMYLMSANNLYKWMNSILYGVRYKLEFQTNWLNMPVKGNEAFQHIAKTIIQFDDTIKTNPAKIKNSIEPMSLDDIVIETRNYEALVLAASTYTQRQTPFLVKYS